MKDRKTISIDIRKDLFGANEDAASLNAELFKEHGVTVIDIMGSVGTGKTQLIEALCDKLVEDYKILMLAGDLATTIDADRVASHGVDTVQINTGTACHLDAPIDYVVHDGESQKTCQVLGRVGDSKLCAVGSRL